MNIPPLSLPDYHTHTARCGHAKGSAADYVEAARSRGLSGIGISDHLPLLHTTDPGVTMSLDELSAYVAEVQELKAKYPGYVYLGIEADYRRDTIQDVVELLRTHPFDYVIGSVHFLDGWGFDDPSQVGEFEERDVDEVYRTYYAHLEEAAGAGAFTMLGHLDLVKKFGHRPVDSLDAEIERVADKMAGHGVVAEINTSGLHKPVAEIYPSDHVLAILRRRGVAVTFGSDAHTPTDVGRDLVAAVYAATKAGFCSYAHLAPGPPDGRAIVGRRQLDAPEVVHARPAKTA
jgi:histidinol-phosphatase (PHP family)